MLLAALCATQAFADADADVASKAQKAVNSYVLGSTPRPENMISKDEARAFDVAGDREMADPFTCMARTIYWEARGEAEAGQIAVGFVILNRIGAHRYPDTICEIVRDGGENPPCQFSWWCDGLDDTATNAKAYQRARDVARRILNAEIDDLTKGAVSFHHTSLNPSWAVRMRRTTTIGDHHFYALR